MTKNRIWTVILKGLGRFQSILCTISLAAQVSRLGRTCRILPGVIVSGGKNIQIGRGVYIGRGVVLDASQGRLEIGDFTEIRDGARLYAREIVLGQRVTVGEGAILNGRIRLFDHAWLARGCDLNGEVTVEKAILGPYTACAGGPGHDQDPLTGAYTMRSAETASENTSILIRDGAWTGTRSVILKGVTIESGTVVGAGAVVNKNYPAHSKLVGVPARDPAASKNEF